MLAGWCGPVVSCCHDEKKKKSFKISAAFAVQLSACDDPPFTEDVSFLFNAKDML